ncbi:stage IV sporulation protein B [Ruminococcus sp. YE71]|uniref:SpoIVB peptidase n=1 Tax=unclassified Ruminococcus TaxID=2608920 RepID=UPI0008832CD1|nr:MULTISPECIES: SpoIVB peptidase [unclassified Ruminococcus]SDA09463.1 stage IV sporulation protein B [Ruminococcus sp. YE78]SFW12216.1 stage IV sporulation protein B [Ruminococcus sp. YE71]
MRRMRHIPQSAAAILSAVCTAVMMTVGYYGTALPDSFTNERGRVLTLSTRLPVTAAAAVECGDSGSRQVSLRLFGSVPIKEVRETAVERPTLIACGQAFGIKLVTDGVMVIDLKKLSGRCPASEAGLRIGDVIEEVNGERVGSNSRISELIRSSRGEDCTISYRRGEQQRECTLTPVFSEGSYRAGMWVRDSSAGIGTLTFADPATGAFAGLGHSICDADTHEPLPLSHGSVTEVELSGCTKSTKGEPGQLIGEFTDRDIGELILNCDGGVYGETDCLPDGEELPLGFAQEVREGSAYILAQLDDGGVKRYNITIERVSPIDCDHDLIIKTSDKRLLRKAGGIVQGMSGSPIIQNGRLVGAVTHVFVDDPTGGYGIFAERMYTCSLGAAKSETRAAG